MSLTKLFNALRIKINEWDLTKPSGRVLEGLRAEGWDIETHHTVGAAGPYQTTVSFTTIRTPEGQPATYGPDYKRYLEARSRIAHAVFGKASPV